MLIVLSGAQTLDLYILTRFLSKSVIVDAGLTKRFSLNLVKLSTLEYPSIFAPPLKLARYNASSRALFFAISLLPSLITALPSVIISFRPKLSASIAREKKDLDLFGFIWAV